MKTNGSLSRITLGLLVYLSLTSCAYGMEIREKPLVVLIFGATGDLTGKKVLPALYHLALKGKLPQKWAIIGIGRREYDDSQFRNKMRQALDPTEKEESAWTDFEKGVFYEKADFDQEEGYGNLSKRLTQLDQEFGPANRLFYLATPPSSFLPIIEKLVAHQLVSPVSNPEKWSRVVIEKPFGRDLDSAVDLQNQISKHLEESQIYRIDHFLGKEGVQTLLDFRFRNALFEPLWNREHIDHIQITLSEEKGIETRAHFWEETGLLRDLVQNHLMQILCLAAMETPSFLDGKGIHAEKIKLLEAIRSIPEDEIDQSVISGQYDAGEVLGDKVVGYRQEKDVPVDSVIETFMAAKFFIDTERWEGVPFYIRSGKRLPLKTTEIAVFFKNPFQTLFIRIQPDPGIFLKPQTLKENSNGVVQLDSYAKKAFEEAYEKLLFDCIQGDRSLFVQADEQFASWKLFSPILRHWKENPPQTFPNYKAGTWGPQMADEWFQGTDRKWELLEMEKF